MSEVTNLNAEVERAMSRLSIAALADKAAKLKQRSSSTGFWDDNQAAQATMKELVDLELKTQPWLELKKSVEELSELEGLHDDSLQKEIDTQLKKAQGDFAALKKQLKYTGKYDDHAAIIQIYAGAGGTDAQDWAAMLERMYVRWAEKQKHKAHIDQRSAGEEAGIKSVTIEIDGPYVYGNLKGEHGVHRLVRLSPFNSDNLRQTSFAKVDVLPKIERPDEVDINEKDIRVDVYRSGGHGGQSVNTTDSAVRVTHIPTGISVAIQNERSQLQNKETAMTILRSKLVQLQAEQHTAKISELKGPNQSAEWGSQIRNYVLHPYKQVKDLRTSYETSDPDRVLDGGIDPFIDAYLET